LPSLSLSSRLLSRVKLIPLRSWLTCPNLRSSPRRARWVLNPLLTEQDRADIAKNGDSNNSDIDFCEFKGRLIINYCWGTQGGPGHEYIAEAEFAGSEAAFLTGWFPLTNTPTLKEGRSAKP